MSNFEFIDLATPGVILLKPCIFRDAGGLFFETYKHADFTRAGIGEGFAQDSYARSSQDILRVLDHQKDPFAEGKLVRRMNRSIFDVDSDIWRGHLLFAMKYARTE